MMTEEAVVEWLAVACQACGNAAQIRVEDVSGWAAAHHLPIAVAALVALPGVPTSWEPLEVTQLA